MAEDEISTPAVGSLLGSMGSPLVDDSENSLEYWKDLAKKMEQLLAESLLREELLMTKIRQSEAESAVSVSLEALRDNLFRVDNFLHFALGKAPVVIAHQDLELRYRFIYNSFPGLSEEMLLGKTDSEICNGTGVEECMEMKREVMRTGIPMQREFDFVLDLFGAKTFLVHVHPVISKLGKTLGVNYISVDITEEALRREKLIVLREEAAVQKAVETELHKTLYLAEDTMRAKQIIATMSHEIRSPLTGVVSMAQVLATTNLDAEQRPMVEVITSSGEHVLDLLNDILDLSKVESGAMKLEAKKFRIRLVVKRVLQLAAAFKQYKNINLVSDVADEVPEEVVGDVLRIRQVLTNLVSNAIKFTSKGEVSIKVRLSSPPTSSTGMVKSDTAEPGSSTNIASSSPSSGSVARTQGSAVEQDSDEPVGEGVRTDPMIDGESTDISRSSSSISSVSSLSSVSSATLSTSSSFSIKTTEDVKVEEDAEPQSTYPAVVWDVPPTSYEMTEPIWLHCEVTDTGIGIPEAALPSLFEEYTQASTTTARKYGGTGLGLAICKQLVGLMGGTLGVTSKQYAGSSFSFTLPLRSVKDGTNPASTLDNDPGRPVVHTGGSEGKGKFRKGLESKLKQTARDPKRTWTPIRESPLSGHGKGVPDVPKEEDNVLSSSRDSAVSVSAQVPASETSENPKTECASSASLEAKVAGGNTNSLKIATPPQSAGQIATPWSPHVAPSSPSSPSSRRSPRILLAEDNNVNVMVAQSMLKKLGLSLEVVSNGAEALDALQRNDYDLVLMDVSMPVMDGLEATRLIRQFEKTGVVRNTSEQPVAIQCGLSSDTASATVSQVQSSVTDPILRQPFRRKTPIIALTANAMAENVAKCYNHGMDSFIAKPVTFEKLEQVLKQYIPWSDHQKVQAR